MVSTEEGHLQSTNDDHRGTYVFRPASEAHSNGKPSKRRRTSKSHTSATNQAHLVDDASLFVPLLNGAEADSCVQLREKLFTRSWGAVEGQIQKVLREANSATLDEVTAFVQDPIPDAELIPTAFILTGANIASQDLLFAQLAERLESDTRSKFVGLRSSESPNIKAVLKKVIQEATSRGFTDDDDAELSYGQDGRKYLNYDLEGLHAFVKAQSCQHIFVAFQDSEGFDSALLSDLIVLFQTWLPRISFTLLFGVATSVQLLQARLLKSTCQLLYGAQFDVVQTEAILDQILDPVMGSTDVVLHLGSSLVESLVARQNDQVASVQAFISSLKYAYMCHFYANPLSVFALEDGKMDGELIQVEHLEAFRQLPSFRQTVETALENGQPSVAKSLIQSDEFLKGKILDISHERRQWHVRLLRAVSLLKATGIVPGNFFNTYFRAVSEGVHISPEGFDLLPGIQKAHPNELISMLERVQATLVRVDMELSLEGHNTSQGGFGHLQSTIKGLLDESRDLVRISEGKSSSLRSAYSSKNRILRTTVVAQKVQLSHDSAELSAEDKAFTRVVDRFTDFLVEVVQCNAVTDVSFHEVWFYDSKAPYRDVFVPRPRSIFERSLLQPRDYLSCECCKSEGEGILTTLPVTSLLYHLYLEAGSIINVADLWAAFFAMVGESGEETGDDVGGHDERAALMLFYKGLAELKAMGFVKPSRKKVDHIAKLKWL